MSITIENAFILVNSVIGIEDERMLPPLIAMVGDVSIPSDDTDDTISILANHETYTETSQEQILVFDRSICISDTLKKKLEAREDFVVYGITWINKKESTFTILLQMYWPK